MRALASVGVFEERAPRQFAMTPLAEPLRADSPQTVRNMARFVGMLTDSRSFLSYSRIDYFARLLCNLSSQMPITTALLCI